MARRGTLVLPGVVKGMTDALVKLASDDDLRHRLGSQGREHVRRTFSLKSLIDRTIDTYREVA
jgi:glycosyltransferase involved in cell wall biosynthesis